jgi:hypothetical protein
MKVGRGSSLIRRPKTRKKEKAESAEIHLRFWLTMELPISG